MTIARATDTGEDRLGASLAHEMKTPVAAIQAATSGLVKNVQALAAALAGSADLPREILDVVIAGLADLGRDPPATGLSVLGAIERAAARLRAAGLGGGAEEAAAVVVRGGWEPDLDVLAPALAGPGAGRILPILEAAGRTRSNLRSLEASARRLQGIAAALRAGEARPEASGGAFPLRRTVEEALATLSHAIPPGVEVEVRCPEGLSLHGSAVQVGQVITNLVANALAAVPAECGRVLVEAARTGGEVSLRVTDNGAGVPEEARARLFTPFFTTRPEGSGTGLGLVISKRLVEAHGGSIGFTSEPGRTCFEVRLPAGPPPAAEGA